MKRLRSILSHLGVALSLCLLTLTYLEFRNPFMQFLTSGWSVVYIVAQCLVCMALALLPGEPSTAQAGEKPLNLHPTGVFTAFAALCAVLSLIMIFRAPSHAAVETAKEEARPAAPAFVETNVPTDETPADVPQTGETEPEAETVVHYTLPENCTVAPEPDPENFGTAPDYAAFQSVLEQAAPLLEGKTTVLAEDTPILEDFGIHYYCDETILAFVWQEMNKTKIVTFSEIFIADASQLQRKISGDMYGCSVQKYPSELSAECNAVFAVNGDFYRFQKTGIHVYNREVYKADGTKLDTCFFNTSGDMLLVRAGELNGEEEVRRYVEENDVLFSLSFGPVLTEDGSAETPLYYPNGQGRNVYARCAIGQMEALHYVVASQYIGCTVREMAEYMLSKGCNHSYAVDGGQSATILLDSTMMNPSQWDVERTLSDILFFATAIPDSSGQKS